MHAPRHSPEDLPARSRAATSLIDCDRYPVDRPDHPLLERVVAQCHRDLDETALCLLPGFLGPAAVACLQREATPLLESAYRSEKARTAYGWMDNSGFAPTHPRGALMRTCTSTVTLDLIPDHSPIRKLFESDGLTDFVRRCLGYRTLYRSACPYLALEVKAYGEGDTISWHFDTNDGVVSLLLQDADAGGHFEYAPYIRDENDEHYHEVRAVFEGTSERVRRPRLEPGCLALFKGRRSVHRVSPVGPTSKPRLIMLLSYDARPGMVFPEATVRSVIDPHLDRHVGSPGA